MNNLNLELTTLAAEWVASRIVNRLSDIIKNGHKPSVLVIDTIEQIATIAGEETRDFYTFIPTRLITEHNLPTPELLSVLDGLYPRYGYLGTSVIYSLRK